MVAKEEGFAGLDREVGARVAQCAGLTLFGRFRCLVGQLQRRFRNFVADGTEFVIELTRDILRKVVARGAIDVFDVFVVREF